MSIIVGIDVGGSTTKIVGFKNGALLKPQRVKADDPIASLYGAFGKFTSENDVTLAEVERIMITGVGSTFVSDNIYGIETVHVNEFDANGRGGLYLSGLEEAIIVSMGTGTAFVHARHDGNSHLGGTGVGGGTLLGLSKLVLGMSDYAQIVALAEDGDIAHVDLRIEDITEKDIIPTLSRYATASNFGRISDLASKSDLALGILNLVFETIAMMAIFAARGKDIQDIVLIGNLAGLPQAEKIFEDLSLMFSLRFRIPRNATFGTVIGAALGNEHDAAARRTNT